MPQYLSECEWSQHLFQCVKKEARIDVFTQDTRNDACTSHWGGSQKPFDGASKLLTVVITNCGQSSARQHKPAHPKTRVLFDYVPKAWWLKVMGYEVFISDPKSPSWGHTNFPKYLTHLFKFQKKMHYQLPNNKAYYLLCKNACCRMQYYIFIIFTINLPFGAVNKWHQRNIQAFRSPLCPFWGQFVWRSWVMSEQHGGALGKFSKFRPCDHVWDIFGDFGYNNTCLT